MTFERKGDIIKATYKKGGKTVNKRIKNYLTEAAAGDRMAQFNLGVSYYKGEDVPQSYEQAVYWYQMAAEGGLSLAQHNLALCYELGHGVPQSCEQAAYWYTKAAEQGLSISKENLEKLKK